jgi:methyltransferase-like protein/predicted O-methyltransferase YrrM
MPTPTSYDDVPYESFPFPQTHPDRMATLGKLFGLDPPELARGRVLELGCAAGGNLIPMALAMPDAEFVGVDLSAVQIADGQNTLAELGLANVRLLATSIADVDASFGDFDYILSHGVYSWVPNAVQEKMLAICAERLSAQGIAYVSYNTLPGWRMRGMIRDLMRYHAMQFGDATQRVAQARAILDFLARSVPTDNNAYGLLLKSELESLSRQPDYYILHEHLEDINEPLYFHEFAERAARHGLQYLAEADFSTMLASNFPREVNETVVRIAPDVVRQEQLMDFLRNRTFRQTLLVRQGLPVNRTVTPERVTPLWVGGALQPANPAPSLAANAVENYRAQNGGTLSTPNGITKAALAVLATHWPTTVAFHDLLREALERLRQSGVDLGGSNAVGTLASDVLQCYAAGLLELRSTPTGCVARPGARPLASPLARWQAARGMQKATSLRHEVATLDAEHARLVQLLDGTRGREAIYRAVAEWAPGGASATGEPAGQVTPAVRARVDRMLAELARSALLVA